MLTSLGLTYLSDHRTTNSIMMDKKAPIEQQTALATSEKISQPSPEAPQPEKPAQAE